MRNAVWVLVTVVLLLGLPFVGLANHNNAEESGPGFGFGGLLIGLFTIELGSESEADTVNGILAANGYAPLPDQMITFGGGGGGGVIGGFSFGGSGWGGSFTSIREGKKAELSLGFGGMDIAYVVGGNERSLLLIGAVLGGGGLDLTLRDRIPVSFEDAVADPTTVTLSQGFFAAEPYVCFQVQPLSWLGFEAHLGYLFTLPGNWEEGGQEIAGPSLRLSGPFVGLSIAFGGIEVTDDDVEEGTEDTSEEVPEDTAG